MDTRWQVSADGFRVTRGALFVHVHVIVMAAVFVGMHSPSFGLSVAEIWAAALPLALAGPAFVLGFSALQAAALREHGAPRRRLAAGALLFVVGASAELARAWSPGDAAAATLADAARLGGLLCVISAIGELAAQMRVRISAGEVRATAAAAILGSFVAAGLDRWAHVATRTSVELHSTDVTAAVIASAAASAIAWLAVGRLCGRLSGDLHASRGTMSALPGAELR